MTTTEIEWTDAVWNPTKGCDRVSPGCDRCYALTMAKRLKGMGQAEYQQDGDPRTSGPGFLAHEAPSALDFPLRKTKPLKIFVNSMSDLFHDNISDEFIAEVWAVMALADHHTFQILTKRHARMRSLLNSHQFWDMAADALNRRGGPFDAAGPGILLDNVWLGVSVEDQHWANLRIPALLDTPAAVRFLSCEPLLDEVSLFANSKIDTETLVDWVIVGGESGPGARPMKARWARQLRDECNHYEIPFLFKQWGNHAPFDQMADAGRRRVEDQLKTAIGPDDAHYLFEVGKKLAGRELDGRTWDEYPAATR